MRTSSPAVVLAILVGACTSTSPSVGTRASAQPSPSDPDASQSAIVGTVTLADTGCTFESAGTLPAGGPFKVQARNETAEASGFDLYRLHDDATYEDWVAYHEAAQESLDAGEGGPGDPVSIAEPIDLQVAIAAEASGVLSAESWDPGIYAIQCWNFPEAGTVTLTTAGPIEITGN